MVQNLHVLQDAQTELDDVLISCIDGGVRLGLGLGSSPASSSGSELSQGSSPGSVAKMGGACSAQSYREPEVFERRRWLRGDGEFVDANSDKIVDGVVDLVVGGEGKEEKERDPRTFVVGFGRRLPSHPSITKITPTLRPIHNWCPGNHLVGSSIWLLITSMLTALDIRRARGEKDVEIEPVVRFENAVFRYWPWLNLLPLPPNTPESKQALTKLTIFFSTRPQARSCMTYVPGARKR
ncbi:hypothetical protein EDB19DRAFT_1831188 [Suillus lakei]|nr:hypothetical protein EDB19DRAFT_1831188 [Suillus lakei]